MLIGLLIGPLALLGCSKQDGKSNSAAAADKPETLETAKPPGSINSHVGRGEGMDRQSKSGSKLGEVAGRLAGDTEGMREERAQGLGRSAAGRASTSRRSTGR